MSALQHATASTEVATFLACCDDVVRKGTQTLSVSAVCHRLDDVEAEWRDVAAQSQLTVSACTQALQHYHDVYDVCARTVPLPQSAWDRWATGITSSFPVLVASRDSQASLEALREALLMKYWGLFCQLYWGCARVVKPRLAFVVEQAHAVTNTASALQSSSSTADTTAGDTCTVESLERALAPPLHAFAKLADDMSHLFGDYGVVGAVERQWLNEDVLRQLDESAEGAVEALVRRSFKRDLQIPSASLPALLQEYEESEVEERKAKEIVAVGKATLQSTWMRAAVALHQHLLDLSTPASPAPEPSESPSDKLLYDERAYELLEELMKELRKAPHGQGSLPALGLLTLRVVEWQPQSASSTSRHHTVGLSGSQTQFYLFLLHQWFARYIATQHRWSVTDMFNAADDSDLWAFVLNRHSFCLMWALATVESDEDAHRKTAKDAQEHFRTAMGAKIDKLRSIFYSVAHCLQLYRASVAAFANPEKRTVRLTAARDAVHEWMHRVGVATFCRGLLGDLLDTTEAWEDSNTQTPVLQLWTLSAEAELKLIMYDTMQLLGCPDNTTDRLETLVQVAVDLCASWNEVLTEKATGAASAVSACLFAPAVALAVRAVQRIRVKLQRSVTLAAELSSADAELYHKLVEWVKKLLSVAGAYVQPAELNTVWDEYTCLVSLPTPSSRLTPAASDGDVVSTTEVVPGFISYQAAAAKRAFGSASPANGGLDDICWGRRNVFKSHRREETEEKAKALQRKPPPTAPVVEDCEAEKAPRAKKARTE
ncbi:hypothetical protein ABB37_01213 [Leptomonas pyrrhocoris]|uniref:Uncharacterized protein n=1 Tax=Leptomonas pyrrhocoris TaxID=157538 RepID=A0A0M9G8L2_LEPPY|nr:hypothetical protein ABB37_01213 [Leptomonas pyrrhocoris]XP_015663149.1 hypothetical protein ABB37_01213 [Leptomonas pyrrhocoris]XP_015663150.1 hypothetical protein ABB37_01213 [Leptomonas pyrrhocoris]KPA84709.1 hypothetical protein ABB37_01213 [Leptomonas pyrrhocoris]KPA84710.1 hypothetical protein ABB37_01213 [Leptomonas pyrrhocoris]KPA84711.1 hypothetical protein ABB37_01213 [Leptomonas pyrrhocoris]|eukprot:XP_015663148.1 hypothetical protein ABB37_01213 [Leptomonas pyrrhocoris]